MDKIPLKTLVKELSLLIGEFIEKSPTFPGDLELAMKLGTILGTIESRISQENN